MVFVLVLDLVVQGLGDVDGAVLVLYVLELGFLERRVAWDLPVLVDVALDLEQVGEGVEQQYFEGELVEASLVIISERALFILERLEIRVIHYCEITYKKQPKPLPNPYAHSLTHFSLNIKPSQLFNIDL